MRTILLLFLNLFFIYAGNSQTCTAPNQCMPTPGYGEPPASHICSPDLFSSVIASENFNNGFGIFSEDPVPVGANDLTVSTAGDTPSFGTGPETTGSCNGTQNDGEFIFLEGSFTLVGETHCMSTTVMIPASGPVTMSFWYHMFGDNIGTLEVFVNGNSEFTISGQQQTANCQPWQEGVIDLGAYLGVEVDIQFCMSEGNGNISTFESDISVDEFQIFNCAPAADLTILKEDSAYIESRSYFIEYDVEITVDPDQDAIGIEYANEIDPQTELVVGSVTTTQGSVLTGNNGGDNSVLVDVGNLAVGESVIITFITRLTDLTTGTKTISCQGIASGDNFEDMVTDDPMTIEIDDETLTELAVIPTLGQWGLIILFMLLLVLGAVSILNRKLILKTR